MSVAWGHHGVDMGGRLTFEKRAGVTDSKGDCCPSWMWAGTSEVLGVRCYPGVFSAHSRPGTKGPAKVLAGVLPWGLCAAAPPAPPHHGGSCRLGSLVPQHISHSEHSVGRRW